MIGTFPGQLSVGDEQVDVDLEVSADKVRLATPISEIGSWPLDAFKATPNGDGTFHLLIDGDDVGFAPMRPGEFETAVAMLLDTTRLQTVQTPPSEEVDEATVDPPTVPEEMSVGESEAEIVALHPSHEDAGPDESEASSLSRRFHEIDGPAESFNESEERLRRTGSFRARFDFRKLMLGLVVLGLAGIVAFTAPAVFSMADRRTEPAASAATAPPTTARTKPTTTTTAAVVAEVSDVTRSGIFGQPVGQFEDTWNMVAEPVSPALTIEDPLSPGDFERGFTSYLQMRGTVSNAWTVDRFEIVIDPSGPSTSDQLGLQALGVAIAVVAPDTTGPERAEILLALGLDVRNPQLTDGIDHSLDRDGLSYRLFYDPNELLLSLVIEPES